MNIAEQIKAVAREIALRKAAYPGFVARGRLKPEQAQHEQAAMEAVLETLKAAQKGVPGDLEEQARNTQTAVALKHLLEAERHRTVRSVVLTYREIKAAMGFFGGHDAELRIEWKDAGQVKAEDQGPEGEAPNEPSPAGWWCCCHDYPEEGWIYLGPGQVSDQLWDEKLQPQSADPAPDYRALVDEAFRAAGWPKVGDLDSLALRDLAVELRAAAMRYARQAMGLGAERQEGGTPQRFMSAEEAKERMEKLAAVCPVCLRVGYLHEDGCANAPRRSFDGSYDLTPPWRHLGPWPWPVSPGVRWHPDAGWCPVNPPGGDHP